MLKSIQSCTAHVHVEISHASNYHVDEKIYMISVHVVNVFYTITCHVCLMFFYFSPICILYVYEYF